MVCTLASAQDWLLFPYQQINYYEYESNDETYLDFITCDSITWQGDTLNSYVGIDVLNQFNNGTGCLKPEWEMTSDYNISFDFYELGYLTLPELLKYHNGWEYSLINGNDFIFNNQAGVGDSWGFGVDIDQGETDSIRFGCLSSTWEDINDLGVTDSVKYFQVDLYSGDNHYLTTTWRLSKQYGLIQGDPIRDLMYGRISNYQMIGFRNPSGIVGEQWPSAQEFYGAYSIGDKLKWEIERENVPGPDYVSETGNIIWDITSINEVNDTLYMTYDFEEIIYHTSVQLGEQVFYEVGTHTKAIRLTDFLLLDQVPKGGFTDGLEWGILYLKGLRRKGTSFVWEVGDEGFYVGADCGIDFILHVSGLSQYEHLKGKIKEEIWEYGPYYQRKELIGYDLGTDCVWGDIYPLSSSEIMEDKTDVLYPNPTSEKLYVSTGTIESIKTYSIFNPVGKKVFHANFNGEYVDVSRLPKGRYFILLDRDDKRSIHSFIKE